MTNAPLTPVSESDITAIERAISDYCGQDNYLQAEKVARPLAHYIFARLDIPGIRRTAKVEVLDDIMVDCDEEDDTAMSIMTRIAIRSALIGQGEIT